MSLQPRWRRISVFLSVLNLKIFFKCPVHLLYFFGIIINNQLFQVPLAPPIPSFVLCIVLLLSGLTWE